MDSPISFKGTLKMSQPQPLFCLLLFFSNTNFTEKTVGISGIQTRIVRVEGKHADHLTPTTAHMARLFVQYMCLLTTIKICQNKFENTKTFNILP